MSKRALKKYLTELSKPEIEEQIVELYGRLKEVKEFYNFVFNPKEDKLIDEAKFKIKKEYFPVGKRKPKKRRSIAQKLIKNFIKLGVEPIKIADLMLYTIEIAVSYNAQKEITQEAFYKSMLKSFKDALIYSNTNGFENDFKNRFEQIADATSDQNWINKYAFEMALEKQLGTS